MGMPRPGILLVGEIHGTVEGPALIGRLACAAAKGGEPITIALEIPEKEQASIDRYMNGSGSAAERLSLLNGSFWQRSSQDGRSSTAMLDLIERLRTIRSRHPKLRVATIEQRIDGSRDVGMATWIRATHDQGSTALIALLGNGHASKAKGSLRRPEYEPAGYLLRDLEPSAVYIAARRWNAWACTPSCGISRLSGRRLPNGAAGFLNGTDHVRGYDGVYAIGDTTPSMPAKGD